MESTIDQFKSNESRFSTEFKHPRINFTVEHRLDQQFRRLERWERCNYRRENQTRFPSNSTSYARSYSSAAFVRTSTTKTSNRSEKIERRKTTSFYTIDRKKRPSICRSCWFIAKFVNKTKLSPIFFNFLTNNFFSNKKQRTFCFRASRNVCPLIEHLNPKAQGKTESKTTTTDSIGSYCSRKLFSNKSKGLQLCADDCLRFHLFLIFLHIPIRLSIGLACCAKQFRKRDQTTFWKQLISF